MGGCVTDRRQDTGAAAPSADLGNAVAAERTPARSVRGRARAQTACPLGKRVRNLGARRRGAHDRDWRSGFGMSICGETSGCSLKFFR